MADKECGLLLFHYSGLMVTGDRGELKIWKAVRIL